MKINLRHLLCCSLLLAITFLSCRKNYSGGDLPGGDPGAGGISGGGDIPVPTYNQAATDSLKKYLSGNKFQTFLSANPDILSYGTDAEILMEMIDRGYNMIDLSIIQYFSETADYNDYNWGDGSTIGCAVQYLIPPNTNNTKYDKCMEDALKHRSTIPSTIPQLPKKAPQKPCPQCETRHVHARNIDMDLRDEAIALIKKKPSKLTLANARFLDEYHEMEVYEILMNLMDLKYDPTLLNVEDQEWLLVYERFNSGDPAYSAIAGPGPNADNSFAAQFRRAVIREEFEMFKTQS